MSSGQRKLRRKQQHEEEKEKKFSPVRHEQRQHRSRHALEQRVVSMLSPAKHGKHRPEQTRQQVSEQDTRKIHSHVQKTQQVTRWGQEEGSEGGKGQGWVEVTCVDGKRGT